MSATVDIQTASKNNVLTLPIQAVTSRADTAKAAIAKAEQESTSSEGDDNTKKRTEAVQEYVFLYDKGVAKMVKVKTGIQDNTYIQITEGVTEGQEVITAPYRAVSKKLKDGDKVTKVDAKDLYADEKK
jgi:HlyD family secretion protein